VPDKGLDRVFVFRIDTGGGTLIPGTPPSVVTRREPTRGRTPRFFTLDPAGARLYAANQDGDTIVEFRVDPRAGTLAATGQVVRVGSPSSIVFR
jgi:6-phosphogluconolactonase